jgi:uncharacterized protein YwbE
MLGKKTYTFDGPALEKAIRDGLKVIVMKQDPNLSVLIQALNITYTPLEPKGVKLRVTMELQALPKEEPPTDSNK